jgi:hypothetical protein
MSEIVVSKVDRVQGQTHMRSVDALDAPNVEDTIFSLIIPVSVAYDVDWVQ